MKELALGRSQTCNFYVTLSNPSFGHRDIFCRTLKFQTGFKAFLCRFEFLQFETNQTKRREK